MDSHFYLAPHLHVPSFISLLPFTTSNHMSIYISSPFASPIPFSPLPPPSITFFISSPFAPIPHITLSHKSLLHKSLHLLLLFLLMTFFYSSFCSLHCTLYTLPPLQFFFPSSTFSKFAPIPPFSLLSFLLFTFFPESYDSHSLICLSTPPYSLYFIPAPHLYFSIFFSLLPSPSISSLISSSSTYVTRGEGRGD